MFFRFLIIPTLIALTLPSCDCRSQKEPAHQPGLHEQSAKVSWLKYQDSVMSQFLPEATWDQSPRNQVPSSK